MVESVYVHPLKIDGIEKSGANHLIVTDEGLTPEVWEKLQKLGVDLTISIRVFEKEACPLDPKSQERLFAKVDNTLKFFPKQIWLDYFRFGGECTAISDSDVKDTHQDCDWCRGRDRQESLSELASKVVNYVGGKSEVGYFAVAFNDDQSSHLAKSLGVDYARLGRVFDVFSPMLYHRMFGKPVTYISEYTKWLAEQTKKPILPIIQIKDMPDDLEDKISDEDIRQAFYEAIKSPSIGVCFFWWVHALEKNKTGIVSNLLSTI